MIKKLILCVLMGFTLSKITAQSYFATQLQEPAGLLDTIPSILVECDTAHVMTRIWYKTSRNKPDTCINKDLGRLMGPSPMSWEYGYTVVKIKYKADIGLQFETIGYLNQFKYPVEKTTWVVIESMAIRSKDETIINANSPN